MNNINNLSTHYNKETTQNSMNNASNSTIGKNIYNHIHKLANNASKSYFLKQQNNKYTFKSLYDFIDSILTNFPNDTKELKSQLGIYADNLNSPFFIKDNIDDLIDYLKHLSNKNYFNNDSLKNVKHICDDEKKVEAPYQNNVEEKADANRKIMQINTREYYESIKPKIYEEMQNLSTEKDINNPTFDTYNKNNDLLSQFIQNVALELYDSCRNKEIRMTQQIDAYNELLESKGISKPVNEDDFSRLNQNIDKRLHEFCDYGIKYINNISNQKQKEWIVPACKNYIIARCIMILLTIKNKHRLVPHMVYHFATLCSDMDIHMELIQSMLSKLPNITERSCTKWFNDITAYIILSRMDTKTDTFKKQSNIYKIYNNHLKNGEIAISSKTAEFIIDIVYYFIDRVAKECENPLTCRSPFIREAATLMLLKYVNLQNYKKIEHILSFNLIRIKLYEKQGKIESHKEYYEYYKFCNDNGIEISSDIANYCKTIL